jgi:hypothetical protein
LQTCGCQHIKRFLSTGLRLSNENQQQLLLDFATGCVTWAKDLLSHPYNTRRLVAFPWLFVSDRTRSD